MLKSRTRKIKFEPDRVGDTPAVERLRDLNTIDRALGLARDRHTLIWPALREIVSRKASPYTVAEIERESARRGIKLQQTVIENGLSRKYALYHDTVLDKMEFVPRRYPGEDGLFSGRMRSFGTGVRMREPLAEGQMTALGSSKPVAIVGCIRLDREPRVELFENPIIVKMDTIGPTGERQGQR
jgi:hypothetical protein